MQLEKEIATQIYLHERESELGSFLIRCLEARKVNKVVCQQQRINVLGLFNMTPQEELFSKLFNHEKALVKDMDLLTLRSHREDLAKIAFEARARLTAVDAEEKERKTAKKRAEGPTGFERSVNVDETTTNAINTIKGRTNKLTKMDKVRQSLLNMGIATADVEKIMSARNIKDTVAKPEGKTDQSLVTPTVKPALPFKNPFAK